MHHAQAIRSVPCSNPMGRSAREPCQNDTLSPMSSLIQPFRLKVRPSLSLISISLPLLLVGEGLVIPLFSASMDLHDPMSWVPRVALLLPVGYCSGMVAVAESPALSSLTIPLGQHKVKEMPLGTLWLASVNNLCLFWRPPRHLRVGSLASLFRAGV